MDHIAGLQLLGRAIEREDAQPRKLLMDLEHGVRAVVAAADGDGAGAQLDVGRVEGREAGGVGQGGAVQERAEDAFEARAGRGCVAGVDVAVGDFGLG